MNNMHWEAAKNNSSHQCSTRLCVNVPRESPAPACPADSGKQPAPSTLPSDLLQGARNVSSEGRSSLKEGMGEQEAGRWVLALTRMGIQVASSCPLALARWRLWVVCW